MIFIQKSAHSITNIENMWPCQKAQLCTFSSSALCMLCTSHEYLKLSTMEEYISILTYVLHSASLEHL